jgi:cell fate (sporulation/competence/biofilm development) regulator YlbF (YheA/YmcA/DUF963 family)
MLDCVKKYNEAVVENQKLTDKVVKLLRENEKMNALIEENNELKKEVIELKLLLETKIERIIKEVNNG